MNWKEVFMGYIRGTVPTFALWTWGKSQQL